MIDKRKILQDIAQIESSGGKNTNHPLMKTGMHSGSSAIGKYALMPLTIDDLVKNDPELQYLSKMDQLAKRKALMSNPALEERLAGKYFERASRGAETPQEVAYKWYHGYNSNPTPEKLAKSDYVNKFNKLTGYFQNKDRHPANNIPNTQNNLQKVGQNLPTIYEDPSNDNNLEDMPDELLQYFMSDVVNPFEEENEDEEDDYKYFI